jgi:hypothetical protein
VAPGADLGARHPEAEPDRQVVAGRADRGGLGHELVGCARRRGGRHNVVEQAVVLVVVEDEDGRLPQLAVGGDRVEHARDLLRAVGRAERGVLVVDLRGT